jgi:hypothetical protein
MAVVNFKGKTRPRAFLIGGLIIAFISALSIEFRRWLDDHDPVSHYAPHIKMGFTFGASIIIAVTVYTIMYLIFGFGEEMMVK